jgi:phenylacetic acid degradation protein paaN
MSNLFDKHRDALHRAIQAVHERVFYAHFPEHPAAYGENGMTDGKNAFDQHLNSTFSQLLQTGTQGTVGTEESPYTGTALNIQYPVATNEVLIDNAQKAYQTWRNSSPDTRAALLIESLERLRPRFHEIAQATQHSTGQSYMMSFQASGPHAADRALETIAVAYDELTHFPNQVRWEKPMGKIAIVLDKTYKPIPKGIGLVIGCSTFPTWNTVPGLYADLMTGNVAIVKPHPKAILPIAIFIAEIQKVLQENGFDPNTVQLAADTPQNPITKTLAENPAVRLIDYTGGSAFGDYIENLPNKTTFTEKAGINSVIIDSARDIREVMRNLAFSVSLYSGQMCTAPQNFFIPANGIALPDGEVCSYDDAVALLRNEIAALVLNPKMGAGTLGAIQNPDTVKRAEQAQQLGKVILQPMEVKNAEYGNARICSPTILEVDANDRDVFERELFGPVLVVIKTKDTAHALALAKEMAAKHGAITCAAYTTNEQVAAHITDEMNSVFAPVSLNLIGFIWVNQHAAFSDFHVTGGNPAGNASFTDPAYINKRFVWVGNRRTLA